MDVQEYINNFEDLIKSHHHLHHNWKEVRDTMIVHTRGVKPKRLLEIKRPNEPPEYKDYRLANHRPITKDKINHAIDSVIRIIVSSNYSIKYSNNISEYVQNKRFQLLEEDIFEPLSLNQLIVEHISRFIFDDPNGVLVWLPVNPVNKALPPILNEQNQKIDVEPVLVDSFRVNYIDEELLVFSGAKKWMVEYSLDSKRYTKPHEYYFLITKDIIYRQIPEYSEAKKKIVYRTEIWYIMGDSNDTEKRSLPFISAKVLGGNVTMNEDNKKYFDSFFQSYAAFGDEAICAFSDNQVVRARFNFPFTAVKGSICNSCKGSGKVPSTEEHNRGQLITCGKCKGDGAVAFSPFGVFTKRPPASTDEVQYALSDFIEFKNPDVSILESSFNAWQRFLELAEDSINLVFTKESQSGVAKEIDREEKRDMLFKIISNVFDIIEFSLNSIECYLVPFQSERQFSKVIPPTSIEIKTQNDLTTELNDMITKQSPQPFINTTAIQLSKKIYNGDREVQIIIEVLTIWDVLFGMTSDQIGQLKATGAIGKKELYIHVNGYKILYTLAEENDFEAMDIDDIIELAEKETEGKYTEEVTLPEFSQDDTGGEATQAQV